MNPKISLYVIKVFDGIVVENILVFPSEINYNQSDR